MLNYVSSAAPQSVMMEDLTLTLGGRAMCALVAANNAPTWLIGTTSLRNNNEVREGSSSRMLLVVEEAGGRAHRQGKKPALLLSGTGC